MGDSQLYLMWNIIMKHYDVYRPDYQSVRFYRPRYTEYYKWVYGSSWVTDYELVIHFVELFNAQERYHERIRYA